MATRLSEIIRKHADGFQGFSPGGRHTFSVALKHVGKTVING
jgi:hypothetical protein